MSTFDFPSQEFKEAKLYIPQVYDPYQQSSSTGSEGRRQCFFRFDAKHNALVLVANDDDKDDDEEEDILDILRVDDVIGASLEVELLQNKHSTEPRVAAAAAASDDDDTNNAPKAPTPSDTQAAAKLTIFMYPRRNPSNESILTTCTGNRRQRDKPVKEFPIGTKQSNSKSSDRDDGTTSAAKRMLHRYAHHRSFQVAPAEDLAHITALVKAIRKVARPTSSASTTERLLVIVNPFSGTKKGLEIYKNNVAPMLEQAGVEHDSIITTHAGHAEEAMAIKEEGKDEGGIADISKYDGIVGIGGDGSIYEIMQGIKKRSDCDDILKKLKLGHIGAGTSNGLSASLAHASQVSCSANQQCQLMLYQNEFGNPYSFFIST